MSEQKRAVRNGVVYDVREDGSWRAVGGFAEDFNDEWRPAPLPPKARPTPKPTTIVRADDDGETVVLTFAAGPGGTLSYRMSLSPSIADCERLLAAAKLAESMS